MWERIHLFHAMLTLTLKSPAVQNECQLKEDTIRAEKSLET